MAEITNEKEIVVAGGLGNATPDKVLAGTTYSSESGFNLQGEFIPSAENISYDNTKSGLAAENTQAAIDEAIEGLTITAAATGERITVDNSADASVREFKVDGKIEQFTTTGKNLLNPTLFEDNKYQNPASGATTHADYWITGKQKILPNTTYTRSTGSYGTFFDANENAISTSYLTNETTFTSPSNAYYVSFCVAKKSQLAFGGEIQLEQGNTSTEYEPYTNGASPNPDYQQDIKGVGNNGEVEVTVTGKNMLPTINEDTEIIDVYGTRPTVKENSIVGGWRYGLIGFEGHAGKVFSAKVRHPDTTSVSRPAFIFKDVNGNTLATYAYNSELINAKNYEMIIPENSYKMWMDFGNQSQIVELYDFQIEEGTVATEYEPYKSQTVKIPVTSPLYEGGYIRLKNGKLEIYRKYKIVDFPVVNSLGTYNDGRKFYSFAPSGMANYGMRCCTHMKEISNDKNAIYGFYQNPVNGQFMFSTDETVETANAKMTGAKVLYKLAEPTTEIIETDIDLSTYNHVTNITNSDNANMEVEYFVNNRHADMVTELREDIAELESDLKSHKEQTTASLIAARNQINSKAPLNSPKFTGDVTTTDTEGNTVSLLDLKDYVIVDHINTLNITVEAKCGAGDTFSVDGVGYVPLMATCKVTNGANVVCVSCSVKYVQGTGYVVESEFLNIGETTETVDAEITILYVRDI